MMYNVCKFAYDSLDLKRCNNYFARAKKSLKKTPEEKRIFLQNLISLDKGNPDGFYTDSDGDIHKVYLECGNNGLMQHGFGDLDIFTEEQHLDKDKKTKIKTIVQNVNGINYLWGFTKDFIVSKVKVLNSEYVTLYTPTGDSYVKMVETSSTKRNDSCSGGDLGLS